MDYKMNDILKKIHSKGYWRVNIKPTIFNEGLLKSYSNARAIIEKCGVLLRGWDYPHFTNAKIPTVPIRSNQPPHISGSRDKPYIIAISVRP